MRTSTRGRAHATAILVAAAVVGGVPIVACSSTSGALPGNPDGATTGANDANAANAASGADATLAMTGGDDGEPDGSSDAARAGAGPDAAACRSQFAQLQTLLDASACGQCELVSCPSFQEICQEDCTCVNAVLALLTCLTIGQNVQGCQSATVSKLSTVELNGLIECNGICSTPCSADTFFPDGGSDGSVSDAGDASDADAGSDADP